MTYTPTVWHDNTAPAIDAAQLNQIEAALALHDGVLVNVKDAAYGAVGDGIADDTAAIQAAINAADVAVTGSGAGSGRIVFFPAGRYKVTASLTVTSGITLAGDNGGFFSTSKGESRLFKSGTAVSLITNADQTSGNENIVIRDLKLMGAGGAAVDIVGTSGNTCERVRIENCYITNSAGVGVKGTFLQTSIIRDCYISACTGDAVSLTASYDNLIDGNQIDTYQSGTNTFGGHGISLAGSGGTGSSNNIIANNMIFLCDRGVYIVVGSGNLVAGNRINTCNYGVMLQTFGGASNVQYNKIIGNFFYDHGYITGGYGVYIDGTCQYNFVEDNLCVRLSGSGFNYAVATLSTAANNVVKGNIARNLVQGASFRHQSSNANFYSQNLVVERGYRVASTLAAPGAVSIDAALSELFVVTLQANATSTTITNGHVGQRLTLVYLQDGTGGRTYVWPTNCKFAGTAPSDTTASKQSSVTFHYDGTNWFETGRTVAVG